MNKQERSGWMFIVTLFAMLVSGVFLVLLGCWHWWSPHNKIVWQLFAVDSVVLVLTAVAFVWALVSDAALRLEEIRRRYAKPDA